MKVLDLIVIRDMAPTDKEFIFATWLRGLRYGNSWFELIDAKIYYKVYHKFIETLLETPGVTVKVACLQDNADVVLGYAVYSKERLDWVFVKKAWRKIGIARSLIPSNVTSVSHLTLVGKNIISKFPSVVFNPFDFT